MQLLRELVMAVAPSGRENSIRDIIEKNLKSCCDEIFTDALGNLICHKKGHGKKLMITAHMDEIGFMTTYIDESGFLRFATIGGVPKYNCINSTVEFTNGTKGKISYENKENPSSVGFEKMYIDIGAASREGAEKQVAIGDMASYSGSFELIGKRIMGKALDDRAGCWALIRAMQAGSSSDNDIYAVFTAQEEVGLRGAKTSAHLINPDMAISVDVSNVGDTPESLELNLRLGRGPAVKIKDASFIIHESVKKILLDASKSASIPFQLEAASYGGTDAGAIHLVGGGIPSGTISIPTRYIHSASEVIDKDDLESTAKLLTEILNIDVAQYLFNK